MAIVVSLALHRCNQHRNSETADFAGNSKGLVNFEFPELLLCRGIEWVLHMDETNEPDNSLYDMITGTDSVEEMSADLNCSK
jgi:hypothetical protein